MGLPIIGDVINAVRDIVSEVVVDKDKRAEINLELIKLQDQAQARLDAQVSAQIEVNKVEAASGSVFVAGWRPAIGWVGAAALAYAYIVQPFLGVFTATPMYDLDGLYNVVLAMLGIGAMRTFEKAKGVSTNDFTDTPKPPPEPAATVNVEVTTETAPPKKKWKL
jgi:hypothetical protein